MALSKDRLRKIHGIPEPTGPVDPAVLARLKFHEAAAKWCAKWLTPLQVFFAFTGFFVVLLPVLLQPWRSVVEAAPFLAQVFHDYSTFSGWALLNLFVGMLTALAKTYWPKYSSGGSMLSYKDIICLEAYPRTKKEEVAFWIDVVGTILVATVWLFLPFGVLAYFIRIWN
jgi:hypothetical protein